MADAALLLLAREGARGLTHRAVDAELQLPTGSTSYYYRTRKALLLAAAERLLALDLVDLSRIPEDLDGLGRLLERWLAPGARERSLARMELLLASARYPDLEFMAHARERFIDRAAQAHTHLDVSQARVAATALIALLDGLTLHGLVTGQLSRTTARRMLGQLRWGPAPEREPTSAAGGPARPGKSPAKRAAKAASSAVPSQGKPRRARKSVSAGKRRT